MTDDARQRLAEKIREAREESGLSQEEVASELDLPRPAISQIENGRRRVEVLELTRLAKLYKKPIAFFASEDPATASHLEVFRRATAGLSEKDREQVLRFAEFLQKQAQQARKPT